MGKQTSRPEPSYEQAEAEAHSEAELEAPSLVPYEKRIINLLHAIYTRSHARLEKVEADIRTKFEAIKARLLVIEEHMSRQPGEHHFPTRPSELFGGDKGGEEWLCSGSELFACLRPSDGDKVGEEWLCGGSELLAWCFELLVRARAESFGACGFFVFVGLVYFE